MKIEKILIANRGEIACRIIQTCKKLGIKTVAVFAEIERHARHVKMADETTVIPAETPTSAYLNIPAIIEIAKKHEAQAIHPGYGFLSEKTEFSKAISDAGLLFIGAPVEALELMGSKAAAKKTMIEAGVPCVPGYHGDNQEPQFLKQQAIEVGFPLLIKASAGGGGKGMKIVNREQEFDEALASAKREAMKGFDNDHVILERFITRPKHIEVQVFADSLGNVVHLFERDCSSQRRYQKVIEEAPATCISQETKEKMYAAAIAATKAVDYQGAGTIEFIVEDEEFFFMEMNTRLQVEHRVTEMITNTDLVEWQIKVAEGQALPKSQDQIQCNGHSIQARIYAEDSFNGFLPSTGLLEEAIFKQGENILIDTGVQKSDSISIHFDPMIAKTVCWAENREACINKTLQILDSTCIAGLQTNLGFLSSLIHSSEFRNNNIFTNSLDEKSIEVSKPKLNNDVIARLIIATTQSEKCMSSSWSSTNNWSNNQRDFSNHTWIYDSEKVEVKATVNDSKVEFDTGEEIVIDSDYNFFETPKSYHLTFKHRRYIFDKINHQTESSTQQKGNIMAPMPGKILDIRVKQNDKIKKNQTLAVMEAMKMELNLKSDFDAKVKAIHVNTNDVIAAETLIIELEEL